MLHLTFCLSLFILPLLALQLLQKGGGLKIPAILAGVAGCWVLKRAGEAG